MVLTHVRRENAGHMDIREMFDEVSNMINDKESNDEYRRKQAFETVNKGFHKKLFFNPVPFDKHQEKNKVGIKEGNQDKASNSHNKGTLGKRKQKHYGTFVLCKCNLL